MPAPSSSPSRGPALSILLLCGVLLLGLAGWFMLQRQQGSTMATIGGPFALVDQNGKQVTDADYKGRPQIVFFGYTHCPDVCPTTLADLSQMLERLGKDEPVSVLFVTVDPERDTPAVLKDYISNFDPRIQGLGGSPAQVNAVERTFRVYAKKIPGQNGDYSMDHTAVLYLMGPDGTFRSTLNLGGSPEQSAAAYRKALQG